MKSMSGSWSSALGELRAAGLRGRRRAPERVRTAPWSCVRSPISTALCSGSSLSLPFNRSGSEPPMGRACKPGRCFHRDRAGASIPGSWRSMADRMRSTGSDSFTNSRCWRLQGLRFSFPIREAARDMERSIATRFAGHGVAPIGPTSRP